MIEKEIIKYNNRIYRKLYLYALMVMVTSIILTITVTSLFFRATERKMFNRHVMGNAIMIQNILSELSNNSLVPNKKIVISERPSLAIEFVPNVETFKTKKYYNQESLDRLLKSKRTQVLDNNDEKSSVIFFVNKSKPESGIIYLEDFHYVKGNRKGPPPPFDDRRIKPEYIAGTFILIFLALLLIPYSQYAFRPFRQLMFSINRVALGDFKTFIAISPKSDFKGIADSFNNMTMKIHDMIQQRDRLVADVSHELRTPLTRIRLALELLDKEDKGKKKYIYKSINEIEQLDKLIDDLLDASKLELNKNDFIFETSDLKKIVEENIEKNNLLFVENSLEINKKFADENINIKVEKQLFERALSNIFSNLAKYAPQNTKVDIKLSTENNKVVLYIRDRGEGVKEDEYAKIFEPFYRADTSRSRKTGGTGLGLSIVKQIINLHDGVISAEKPEDGEGGLAIKIVIPKV